MAKRRVDEAFDTEELLQSSKHIKITNESSKKHTLDSDEEDSGEEEERYNILDENDIEGEEDGISGMDGEVKVTPFNMKEEMEEGHFDKEGHYQWNKEKLIKDNWLDNIDWVKVKTDSGNADKYKPDGLGDETSSDEEDEDEKKFDLRASYGAMLELMKPKETVKKALQRLGGQTAKLSSIERWRRKKAGIEDDSAQLITKLTELANEILTRLGNMDIYDETYELIEKKFKERGGNLKSGVEAAGSGGAKMEEEGLDMYADDFDTKEKKVKFKEEEVEEKLADPLMWEYKWKQEDETIHGPYTTEQMQKWTDDGYFKDGVYVRKVGNEDNQFYTSKRIDFDLFL